MNERPLRILLLDSDSQHSARAARALEEAGFETYVVEGLQQWQQMAGRANEFDVILLDHGFAGLSGLQLLGEMRKQGVHAPVIVLASSGQQRVAASAVRAGVAEYLIKEPDFSHLEILPNAVGRVAQAHQEGRLSRPCRSREEEQLRHLVLIDPLTSLYNRRFLSEALPREFQQAHRTGSSLSCAMMDLDHFREINNTFGHLVGDEVLVWVARMLRQNFRAPDLLFRYGGEEFIVLMPNTGLNEAQTACQRLLDRLRSTPAETAVGPLQVTASIGLATFVNGNFLSPVELLNAADCALYAAKCSGRNRMVVAKPPSRPAKAMRMAA